MQTTWIALGALAGLTAVAIAAWRHMLLDGLDPAARSMVRTDIGAQAEPR